MKILFGFILLLLVAAYWKYQVYESTK